MHVQLEQVGVGLGSEAERGWVRGMPFRWVVEPMGGGEMLTVVILLAFLSMSEALSRQGYLLVPEKAETADPALSPACLSLWLTVYM